MEKKLLFVGLDVDNKSFHAALVGPDEEQWEFCCKPVIGPLVKKLRDFEKKGFQLKICYEASYFGFHLCRELRARGFDCEVIAPSLIPENPGPRIKTDRLDCLKLARYFQKGLLTSVYVPDETDEAVRDLVRGRSFLVRQLRATKVYVIALCRRSGWDYRQAIETPAAQFWTKQHRLWIGSQMEKCENKALKMNLRGLLDHLRQLEDQIAIYDQQIEEWAQDKRYSAQTEALLVYRGINANTAMTLATEIVDIKRFAHPRSLVSFVGMDITEYSSGAKQRQYHMTKMGNRFLRTALIEVAQHAALAPRISRDLRARRNDRDPAGSEIADKCMQRLYRRSHHLINRGKPRNLVKVACARELVGFIWESLRAADARRVA